MKKTVLALSILTVLLYACKDKDVTDNLPLTSTQASKDHLLAEQTFNDVGRIVEEAFISSGVNKSCATYTKLVADSTDQDTLIINFGADNCLHNYKLRRGKVLIIYTGKYRDSLSIITTTFDNYYVNNNLVQGERVVTNQGRNNSGNLWFTVNVNNASINTNDGSINWNSTRTREWLSGDTSVLNISDDSYKITGTASGTGVNNNSFSMEIISPLLVDLGCLPSCVVKSGIATISPNGYADRVINYGDSLCDCKFDVIIEGTTYPVELSPY